MKNIAIVGNAQFNSDYSHVVDSSDFVIRFNEAGYYSKNNGIKVDALCLTNLASPGRTSAKYRTVLKLSFLDEVKEVWFPRPGPTPWQFWVRPFIRRWFHQANYAKYIVKRNNLKNKKIINFSQELYDQSCIELEIPLSFSLGAKEYYPSSGYLAINYVLQRFKSESFKIMLLGFTFNGIDCHHWKRERNMVSKLEKAGVIEWLK